MKATSLVLVCLSRCDSISTSSMRTLAPRVGCSRMMRARLSRDSTATRQDSAAMQLAKRGSPSIIDISPNDCPAPPGAVDPHESAQLPDFSQIEVLEQRRERDQAVNPAGELGRVAQRLQLH